MSTITDKLIQLKQEHSNFIEFLSNKKIAITPNDTFTTLVNKLNTSNLFDVSDATVTESTLKVGKLIYNNSGDLIQGTLQMPNAYIPETITESGSGYPYKYILDSLYVDKIVLDNQHCQIPNVKSINEIDATKVTKFVGNIMYRNDSIHLPDFVDLSNCKSYSLYSGFIKDSLWKNINIPFFNTIYLTSFVGLIDGYHSGGSNTSGFKSPLQTIGGFAADSCIDVRSWYSVSIFTNYPNVTYFGGFKNLGKAYDPAQPEHFANYTFNAIPETDWNLTKQSILDILDGLYDIASKGCARQLVKIGSKYKAMLTEEELNTVIQKGWDVE